MEVCKEEMGQVILRLTRYFKHYVFQAGFLGSWSKVATSGTVFPYY